MFEENITFINGIIVGDKLFTEAVLVEEIFAHTLRASGMAGIDVRRLDDQAYYAAALLAVRVKIPGLFEARMACDESFKAMVEAYAEAAEIKVDRVTSAQIHPVSAEIIESLSRTDGRMLIAYSAVLNKRRSDFRTKAIAVKDGSPGTDEDGIHGGADPGKEPGGDPGDIQGLRPAE